MQVPVSSNCGTGDPVINTFDWGNHRGRKSRLCFSNGVYPYGSAIFGRFLHVAVKSRGLGASGRRLCLLPTKGRVLCCGSGTKLRIRLCSVAESVTPLTTSNDQKYYASSPLRRGAPLVTAHRYGFMKAGYSGAAAPSCGQVSGESASTASFRQTVYCRVT